MKVTRILEILHLGSLQPITVVQMAITDIHNGDGNTAIHRLRSDMDRFRTTNPNEHLLYNFLRDTGRHPKFVEDVKKYYGQ